MAELNQVTCRFQRSAEVIEPDLVYGVPAAHGYEVVGQQNVLDAALLQHIDEIGVIGAGHNHAVCDPMPFQHAGQPHFM